MKDTRYDSNFLYFQEEGHKYTDTMVIDIYPLLLLFMIIMFLSLTKSIGYIKKVVNLVLVKSHLKNNGKL